MKIYKDKLKNGLRFLIIPKKALPNFTALVLVGAGSRFENEQIAGISHFLEHMFFKGTKKRPTAFAISSELDRVGASYNAFTGKEYTGYYVKAAPEYFDLALDILSDEYFNSKFEEKEIKREQGVIIEEINMLQDTPLRYIQDLFEKVVFQGKPLGQMVLGTKKSVVRINRKKMVSYFNSFYTAENTVICLAGNVDIKKVRLKVKKYFGKNFRQKEVLKPKQIYFQKEPRALIHFQKTDQTHLAVGVRGYDIFNEKRFPAQVLSTILGGNMSSRLFIKIRERRGLAYEVWSESENYLDTGILVTHAGVPNEKALRVIKLILREYQDIATKGVSKEELHRAKEYLKGRLAVKLDESNEIASWVAAQEIEKNDILTPKEICGKINSVKEEDVKNVAEEIFKNNRLNLAVIGPFKSDNRFKKILRF